MQQVCIDVDDISPWHYDAENKVYIRYTPEGKEDVILGGKHSARIHGEFLPNPDSLWLIKCNQSGVKMASGEGQKLKPTATVYALWQHWINQQKAVGENAQ